MCKSCGPFPRVGWSGYFPACIRIVIQIDLPCGVPPGTGVNAHTAQPLNPFNHLTRPVPMKNGIVILTEEDMRRTLERLAYQVLEKHGECANLLIIGIQRRGVDLAARLRAILGQRLGCELPFGALDINLYRDDWTSLESHPVINRTELPQNIDGQNILLVDDVLYTGRTIRAALEGILDFGRPRTVELLVLVDRGHRELPIHADYVGKVVNTARDERVDVLTKERDGQDVVMLREKA